MPEHEPRDTEAFMGALREGLELADDQADAIVQEVRADLEAHVERFRGEGAAPDEAGRLALAELGNPYELAHHMRREVPPFDGRRLRLVRIALLVPVLAWVAWLMWTFRAWSYGFPALAYAMVIGVHLPLVLLLWPRLVWRSNRMFRLTLLATGLAFLLAAFPFASGTSEVTVDPLLDPTREPSVGWGHWVGVALLVGACAALVAAMQQAGQRSRVVLALILLVAAIELPFQIEELLFRQDVDVIRHHVLEVMDWKAERPDTWGGFPHPPGETPFGVGEVPDLVGELEALDLWNHRIWIRQLEKEPGQFVMWWHRPLQRHFSIGYASDGRPIWIMD